MNNFIIKLNGTELCRLEATDELNIFNIIRYQLPKLLTYPHFWYISCCPKKIDKKIFITTAEKIVYYSKPYQYYIKYKNDPKNYEKIETERGYYFEGKNIISTLKEINYLVTASDSESSSESDTEHRDLNDNRVFFKNRKKFNRLRKKRINKIRNMGLIKKRKIFNRKVVYYKKSKLSQYSDEELSSDEELNSSSEEFNSDEKIEYILEKYLIYYIKKHLDFSIFSKLIDDKDIELICMQGRFRKSTAQRPVTNFDSKFEPTILNPKFLPYARLKR